MELTFQLTVICFLWRGEEYLSRIIRIIKRRKKTFEGNEIITHTLLYSYKSTIFTSIRASVKRFYFFFSYVIIYFLWGKFVLLFFILGAFNFFFNILLTQVHFV